MRTRQAFTLIEMTIVITIIGLLGAIAMGRLSHFTYQARVNALAANVLNMSFKVDEYRAIEGTYPAEIKDEWFVGRTVPNNPFAERPDSEVLVDGSGDAGLFHPQTKVYADDGSDADAAYWYNPANGMLRGLICKRPTQADTIRLYNIVNGAGIDGLSDTAIASTQSVGAGD
jgi:prepilin-type N-terminal cleavage/methylation domain-containing protein